jgi:hypothetical protein
MGCVHSRRPAGRTRRWPTAPRSTSTGTGECVAALHGVATPPGTIRTLKVWRILSGGARVHAVHCTCIYTLRCMVCLCASLSARYARYMFCERRDACGREGTVTGFAKRTIGERASATRDPPRPGKLPCCALHDAHCHINGVLHMRGVCLLAYHIDTPHCKTHTTYMWFSVREEGVHGDLLPARHTRYTSASP